MLKSDDGILCATTAFGKTVIAAWLIAARKVNTLVLVHRRQLLDQWRERLAAFLNLPIKSIGQIGGGRRRTSEIIDVAVIQSLNRRQVVDDMVANYGHVIVDACHHLSAVSFEQVLRQVKACYIMGLTATPQRKDERIVLGELHARLDLGRLVFTLNRTGRTQLGMIQHST